MQFIFISITNCATSTTKILPTKFLVSVVFGKWNSCNELEDFVDSPHVHASPQECSI